MISILLFIASGFVLGATVTLLGFSDSPLDCEQISALEYSNDISRNGKGELVQ
jgi:hypothetical protein